MSVLRSQQHSRGARPVALWSQFQHSHPLSAGTLRMLELGPPACRIDDTNAKEIKGFPVSDRPRSLNRQHNFANMFAGLHAPVRVSCLFKRESAVHQGFDAPLTQ